MINNIISIVLLVVIFRIIFEILFFSKSIKEGFIENDNDNDNGCCPDNNYTYKTYPVPNNCIDGEDNISCLWRVKRSNQIININGVAPFKTYNKKIYGSNVMIGDAMNSLSSTNQETELGWVKGTLTDISSSMLDTNYFWKLFNPNVNLKCNSGNKEGVFKPGRPYIAGKSPYIKSCIKNNISLINQYENKELTEIPCDGMDMSCYYTLFRGSQGSVGMSESDKDITNPTTTSDMFSSDIDVYINKGDWWLQDDYVQKRVLLYNLKYYINYYGSWDDDLDTVIEEMHNKTDKEAYLNNNPNDTGTTYIILTYNSVNRVSFLERVIGIWYKPDNLKNVNRYLAERLGRNQVWIDSDSDSEVQDSEITNSLKVEKYVSGTIYDFKLNDDSITRNKLSAYTEDSDPSREEFHLFKYDEKIEAIIEEIDLAKTSTNYDENALATKMFKVLTEDV